MPRPGQTPNPCKVVPSRSRNGTFTPLLSCFLPPIVGVLSETTFCYQRAMAVPGRLERQYPRAHITGNSVVRMWEVAQRIQGETSTQTNEIDLTAGVIFRYGIVDSDPDVIVANSELVGDPFNQLDEPNPDYPELSSLPLVSWHLGYGCNAGIWAARANSSLPVYYAQVVVKTSTNLRDFSTTVRVVLSCVQGLWRFYSEPFEAALNPHIVNDLAFQASLEAGVVRSSVCSIDTVQVPDDCPNPATWTLDVSGCGLSISDSHEGCFTQVLHSAFILYQKLTPTFPGVWETTWEFATVGPNASWYATWVATEQIQRQALADWMTIFLTAPLIAPFPDYGSWDWTIDSEFNDPEGTIVSHAGYFYVNALDPINGIILNCDANVEENLF